MKLYDEVPTESAPRIKALVALLRLFTLDQLMFLVNHCETAVKVTGFARVEIVFENGHAAFLYPAEGLRFPRPTSPTPDPSPFSKSENGEGRPHPQPLPIGKSADGEGRRGGG